MRKRLVKEKIKCNWCEIDIHTQVYEYSNEYWHWYCGKCGEVLCQATETYEVIDDWVNWDGS